MLREKERETGPRTQVQGNLITMAYRASIQTAH